MMIVSKIRNVYRISWENLANVHTVFLSHCYQYRVVKSRLQSQVIERPCDGETKGPVSRHSDVLALTISHYLQVCKCGIYLKAIFFSKVKILIVLTFQLCHLWELYEIYFIKMTVSVFIKSIDEIKSTAIHCKKLKNKILIWKIISAHTENYEKSNFRQVQKAGFQRN